MTSTSDSIDSQYSYGVSVSQQYSYGVSVSQTSSEYIEK